MLLAWARHDILLVGNSCAFSPALPGVATFEARHMYVYGHVFPRGPSNGQVGGRCIAVEAKKGGLVVVFAGWSYCRSVLRERIAYAKGPDVVS